MSDNKNKNQEKTNNQTNQHLPELEGEKEITHKETLPALPIIWKLIGCWNIITWKWLGGEVEPYVV